MKVRREDFLSVLESIKPGLSVRGVLEQSTCFVFQGDTAVTFNDEVACRAPTGLDDVTGAVEAGPLLALLHKLADDEIDVSSHEGQLLIQGKRRRCGLHMQAEIHLPMGGLEPAEKWKELPDDYGDALAMVQECAGKDLNKFATACVHLHPKWMEAFDNFQMIRYKIKTGVERPTLVKRDSVKHIAGMGATEFGETKSWIHYRNPSGLVVSCRRFLEDFFDLGENIKEGGEPISLPKGLGQSAECAEIFSSENVDNNQVSVELRPGKLRVRGQGVSGWFSEVKDVKYSGPEFTFLIAPKLLKQITAKHNSCLVSPTQLKVDGGRWVYLARLGLVMNDKGDE